MEIRVQPTGEHGREAGGRDDGNGAATVVSERFQVAICACRRSKTYPFCDTSHRRKR
ncbi:iron-binding zinc finger protein, CDGSH type [Saccharomonospora marina XMU15]|uniref:Iron-binding zinc finger protein, CDGSH type n=1 Tax=Saccharomonospora marina XMU15 TaxID=882083 RepID=H5X2G2_9PSEU|nr:iron-binding zinc finger protein, CDGSH type [Saccharomonospora marina XMU15]